MAISVSCGPRSRSRRFFGMVAVLALAASACSSAQSTPTATQVSQSTPTASEGFQSSAPSAAVSAAPNTHTQGRIAFLMPDLITTRWDAQDKPTFQNELAKVCSTCTFTYYNAKGSADTQLSQVQAAIANGVDVIVLAPIDKAAAVGMVQQAHAAGVIVIAYATLIDSPYDDYVVSVDVPRIGAMWSQSLIDGLKAKGITSGNLICINGDPSDDFGFRYKAGVHSVLDTSSFKCAAEYDTPGWDPVKAQSEMDQAITKVGKGNFVGVSAANDQIAGGVIASMKAAGIDPKTVLVTGQDGSLAALQRILIGEQYNTVNLPINIFAAKTADLAAAVGTGKEPPAGVVNGSANTPSGYKAKAYFYDPQLITITNIKQMIVPIGFWTRDQVCIAAYAAACTAAGI